MFDVFPEIIFCFLAVYGFFMLWVEIFKSIRLRVNCRSKDVRLVLLVKNQEDRIEGIVRSLFTEELHRKIMADGMLTVVDMGSGDETFRILKKLEKDYCNFIALGAEEKEEIFSGFDEPKGGLYLKGSPIQ